MTSENLLSPITCGPLKLKNRIVMAPFPTGMENEDGFTALTEFYQERAKHGVSMITVSAGTVHGSGRRFAAERMFSGVDSAMHRMLTAAVKEYGAVPVLQLIHAGVDADSFLACSASGSKSRITGRKTRRAPNFYIERIISHYASTSRHAADAGYQGVEIDASGRSLIADFLSPSTNRRTDKWGYSQLAQFKLALDVVKAVKKSVGDDFAIGFRFNLLDLQSDGADWEGTMRLVRMLKNAGVHYLCCEFGAGDCRIPNRFSRTTASVWTPYCEALAEKTEETGLLIFFGQNSYEVGEIEKIAQRWNNSVFEFAQPLIADSFFVEKIKSGREDQIRKCLGCCSCCIKNIDSGREAITCTVNPMLFCVERKKTIKNKKIAVVGAGVAGLTISRICARRGHRVVLFESSEKVGGQLWMMGDVPGKHLIKDWLEGMRDELLSDGVELKLNTKADAGVILSCGADTIVLCTGSEPYIPDIQGIDASNVLTCNELIQERIPTGDRVAVLGINQASFDVAHWLVSPQGKSGELTPEKWRSAWGIGDIRNNRAGVVGFIPEIDPPKRQVYLFETEKNSLSNLIHNREMLLKMQWLTMLGVQIITDITIDLIDNYSVRYSFGRLSQDSLVTRIDHVVVCSGHIPCDSLKNDIEGTGERTKVYLLGSAAAAHEEGLPSIDEIIHDAEHFAGVI